MDTSISLREIRGLVGLRLPPEISSANVIDETAGEDEDAGALQQLGVVRVLA